MIVFQICMLSFLSFFFSSFACLACGSYVVVVQSKVLMSVLKRVRPNGVSRVKSTFGREVCSQFSFAEIFVRLLKFAAEHFLSALLLNVQLCMVGFSSRASCEISCGYVFGCMKLALGMFFLFCRKCFVILHEALHGKILKITL